MKEQWKDAPITLKRQIYKRMGVGILFLILGIITWTVSKDFMFTIPCFIGSVFFALNGAGVLFASLLKRYIVLSGECVRLEQTRFLKRTKVVYLITDYGKVKLPIRRNIHGLQIGVQVRCYISLKTSVYEYGGVQTVSDYYAIEVYE